MPAVHPHSKPPAQTAFDFAALLGAFKHRALMRVPEIARVLGRSPAFVEGEMDAGMILAHSLPGRKRTERSATPLSVALWLAATADYDGEAMQARLREVFAMLSPELRRWAVQELMQPGGSK